MINLDDPRSIAAQWHGGQNSALYAYASTGIIVGEEILAEIDHCLSLATNRHDERELAALRSVITVARRDAILRDADRLTRTIIGTRADLEEFSRVKSAILQAIHDLQTQ